MDLTAFARRIIEAAEYGDLDGGDLQDIAVECGVLVAHSVTEACGENCACAEYNGDPPWTCYRLAEELRGDL